MLRERAFGRRSVIELREDLRDAAPSVLTLTSGGRPLAAGVRLGHIGGEERFTAATVALPALAKLRSAAVDLPPGTAGDLKIWAHRVTPDGFSDALPVMVEVGCGATVRRFDLALSGGQVVVPLDGGECAVRLTLPAADAGAGREITAGGEAPRPSPAAPGSSPSR
jgi:hypothetical protein